MFTATVIWGEKPTIWKINCVLF